MNKKPASLGEQEMRALQPGASLGGAILRRAAFMLPFLALALSGCASNVRTLDYSWGKIVLMDAPTLRAYCTPTAGKWDDGTPRPRYALVNGCTNHKDKVIAVLNTCSGAEALPHELAHLDGFGQPDKAGYDWTNPSGRN